MGRSHRSRGGLHLVPNYDPYATEIGNSLESSRDSCLTLRNLANLKSAQKGTNMLSVPLSIIWTTLDLRTQTQVCCTYLLARSDLRLPTDSVKSSPTLRPKNQDVNSAKRQTVADCTSLIDTLERTVPDSDEERRMLASNIRKKSNAVQLNAGRLCIALAPNIGDLELPADFRPLIEPSA